MTNQRETKEEIIKRIKSLGYSLFNDEPADFSTLGLKETNDDTWAMDSNFNAALSLLRYRKKIDTAIKKDLKVFIEKNLKADPTDIHAWINKCMFEVTNVPADLTRAKEALDQVTSLQGNETATLEARIQYAFWLGIMMNDDIEKRKRGLVIFKDELNEDSNPRYHYLYMKILGNHMVRESAEEDHSTKKETAILFSDQVQRLFDSGSPNYRLQMFLCLADVQRHDSGRRIIKELRDREELKFDISGDPNIRFCVQQIDQIILQNPEIPVFANFYARIALCLLSDAMDGDNSQMQENLRKALSYAEKYKIGRPSRLPMGPKACARIILYQWAIEYFAVNQENLSLPQHSYAQKLKYLAEKYHASQPDNNPKSKKLLEDAHHHLKEHYRLGGPFVAYYPRVLMLLGEEPGIVEPIYNRGPYGIPIDRINALEHKGLFLETQRRLQEAHDCWKGAETVIDEKKIGYKSFIVLDGLRRLPARECDRSDNWRR